MRVILKRGPAPAAGQDTLEYLRLFPRRARRSIRFTEARALDFWPARFMHKHPDTDRLVSDAFPHLTVEIDHEHRRYIIRRH